MKSSEELSIIREFLSSSLNAISFISKIESIGFKLIENSPIGDTYGSENSLLMLTVLPSKDPNNIYCSVFSPKEGDSTTLVDECKLK